MGKGVAYQFKMKFPENNKAYIKACKSGELAVGKVHCYVEEGITIINFPTKNKWRENSKIEYIEKGMNAFVEVLPELGVKKIAIPPLGCGNGGLIWAEVKNIIENKIAGVSDKYDFVIFEPSVSYKAIPKKPPQISVSGLVLLDIRLNLKRFNGIRLQKAGYLVNFFMGEE
ncbi:MAG: macro domain-containing protein, partial [Lachnospiraceae bacterium]|nr:macro domain-containing protein [Lachnospiraceae bacterium]